MDLQCGRWGGGRGLPGRAFAGFVVALTLSGCATKGDVRDVETELAALRAQQERILAAVEQQSLATADTLRTQSQQLYDFRGSIQSTLNQILRELEQVRSVSDVTQRSLVQLRDQVEAMQQRAARGGFQMQGSGDVGGGQPVGAAEDAYNAAIGLYNRGQLSLARRGFEALLQQHPNSDVAPLALLRLGDIAEQNEEYERAAEHFEAIGERFPGATSQVIESLYRLGKIYGVHLDQPERGIRYLDRLINTYEGSSMVELARELREELGGLRRALPRV